MRLMKTAMLAAVLCLLAGCAAVRIDSDAARDSWRNAKYDEVVSQWGAPSRSTTLTDGRPAHTWISEGTSSRGSFYPSIGIFGGSGVGVGTSVAVGAGGYERVRCERTLIFSIGRVVEQHWMGSADYCNEFARK